MHLLLCSRGLICEGLLNYNEMSSTEMSQAADNMMGRGDNRQTGKQAGKHTHRADIMI